MLRGFWLVQVDDNNPGLEFSKQVPSVDIHLILKPPGKISDPRNLLSLQFLGQLF